MTDTVFDWFMSKFMPWFILGTIAAAVVGFGLLFWALLADARRPTFELKKDDWACTASHQQTTTSYVMVGKVMVPSTSTSTVCDQWSRRADN